MPTIAAPVSSDGKLRAIARTSNPQQRNPHPHAQRIRLRAPVRVHPHQRLQQRSRQLIGQRDQPDLREIQVKRDLQHRINRGQHGRQHVVHQVAQADRRQHLERGFLFDRLECLYLSYCHAVPASPIPCLPYHFSFRSPFSRSIVPRMNLQQLSKLTSLDSAAHHGDLHFSLRPIEGSDANHHQTTLVSFYHRSGCRIALRPSQ